MLFIKEINMQIYFGTRFSENFKNYLSSHENSLDNKLLTNLETIKNDGHEDAELGFSTTSSRVPDGYDGYTNESDVRGSIILKVGEDTLELTSCGKRIENDHENLGNYWGCCDGLFWECLKKLNPDQVEKIHTQIMDKKTKTKRISSLLSD
jgi:hypothetical protein